MGTGSQHPPADVAHVLLWNELQRLKAAFEYVLPFVHLDIRDQALKIARGDTQPEGKPT